MKTFFKAVGGKTKLVPQLKELMPPTYDKYFEPFVGGGALFFDLLPKLAVLNDSNRPMITTYRAVRDDVVNVIKILKTFKYEEKLYYKTRERNFSVGSHAQRAAEFLYINRCCFNGIFRVNQAGQFNVPFGRYVNPMICDADTLKQASIALKNILIQCKDFTDTVRSAKEGDFAYFDPPYAPISKTSNFVGFSKKGFGDVDQVRLRDCALDLKRRGVHVIISNSDAPIIRELYAGKKWKIVEVQAARAVNSKGKKRGKITELIIR